MEQHPQLSPQIKRITQSLLIILQKEVPLISGQNTVEKKQTLTSYYKNKPLNKETLLSLNPSIKRKLLLPSETELIGGGFSPKHLEQLHQFH